MSAQSLVTRLPRQGRVPTLPMAVAVYAACAAMLSPQVFLGMLGSYAHQMIVLPFLLAIGLPIAGIILRPHSPSTFMRDVVQRGGMRLILVMLTFWVGLSAFTTFKLAIPDLVPFYADPMLADADAWLHGGDPGRLAQDLVPGWAQYPLGYLYGPVWFILWFGLTAFVALHDDRRLRQRYFWCMALSTCLLGTVLAAAFSSVGPVFYDQIYGADRFASLVSSVYDSAVGADMKLITNYLLSNYQERAHQIGTGISAMPSMHLAIVTLNANMLTSLDRRVGAIAWLYVGLILLGSVYLGWHYALDGYLSIAVVSLIWWGAGRVLKRREIDGG